MLKVSCSFYEVYNDKVYDLLQIKQKHDKITKTDILEAKELKLWEEDKVFVL